MSRLIDNIVQQSKYWTSLMVFATASHDLNRFERRKSDFLGDTLRLLIPCPAHRGVFAFGCPPRPTLLPGGSYRVSYDAALIRIHSADASNVLALWPVVGNLSRHETVGRIGDCDDGFFLFALLIRFDHRKGNSQFISPSGSQQHQLGVVFFLGFHVETHLE